MSDDTNDAGVLGGWHIDGANVPDGSAVILIDGPPGDAIHLTIECDVALTPEGADHANDLIQRAIDGVTAGRFEIAGPSLVRVAGRKDSA